MPELPHSYVHISASLPQRSRTKFLLECRFSIGFGPGDYEGWDVPRSAVCKLHALESDGEGGVIQSESEILRTRNPSVRGQEEMHVPAQADLPLLCLCAVQALDGLTLTCVVRGIFLTHLPTQKLTPSRNATQTSSEVIFSQLAGRPFARTSWHPRLSITV